jgi:hypothetical protein
VKWSVGASSCSRCSTTEVGISALASRGGVGLSSGLLTDAWCRYTTSQLVVIALFERASNRIQTLSANQHILPASGHQLKVTAAPKHVGAKGSVMAFRDSTNDACPACLRATTLSVIEPHPTRAGLEIHTFNCDRCGPLKSRVIEISRVA